MHRMGISDRYACINTSSPPLFEVSHALQRIATSIILVVVPRSHPLLIVGLAVSVAVVVPGLLRYPSYRAMVCPCLCPLSLRPEA